MDKLVKGENEMWKMPAKERIQTNSASAVKRELDLLSVCPATHLKMFRQKRNTHKLLRRNHPYYRNVARSISAEFSSNPNQTHESKPIKVFRISGKL